MDKIILALDSRNIDRNAIRFACHLIRLTHSRLTGFFLEKESVDEQVLLACAENDSVIESVTIIKENDDEQEALLTEENIRLFSEITEREGVHAFIEFGNGIGVSEIISKSRFADVVILNAATCISGYEESTPSLFVKNILNSAECPVLISPDIFNGIDNIVFCYDGSKSSVFAMKQFTYLFPEFKYTRAKVIYLNTDDEFLEEDRQAVTEWLNYHYGDVEFVALEGNALEAFFNYLLQKRNDLVVMGAYGRGLLASFFRNDEKTDGDRTTSIPIFISHH